MARKPGTIAGLIAAECAFALVDPSLDVRRSQAPDGSAGQPRARRSPLIEGSARSILTAERVALNFVGHLSGVATATRALVEAVAGTKARIVCTRKTTPGLRVLEKYAVRCGGGFNHRFGLDDAVLIKDNHLVAAGGIRPAIERVRAGLGHMAKIELEVDTLAQLEEALALGVDTILLDNMSVDDLKRAVATAQGPRGAGSLRQCHARDRARHRRDRRGLHLLRRDHAFGAQPRRCAGLLASPRVPPTAHRVRCDTWIFISRERTRSCSAVRAASGARSPRRSRTKAPMSPSARAMRTR